MKRSWIFILTLLAFWGMAATAQEQLTLDQAVATALDQNQALRGAGHDLDAASWGKLNAVSNFLPKVELSSSVTRIDPETDRIANASIDFIKELAPKFGIPQAMLADMKPFVYRDTYASSVTVVQPIYNGGAEIVGLHAANALQDKSEYAYRDTEQDVIARVRTSYYNVLKAQELVNLASEAAERTQRYLDMTRRRAEVGMRTKTDVLRWEVQLASGRGSVINADNYLAMARLQLNEVMGVELDKAYTLVPVAYPDSVHLVASTDSAAPADAGAEGPAPIDPQFLESHPSMRMMEANLRLADVGIEKSWINFKPKVNIAFQYGWEKNSTLKLDGYRPWALALSVSLPIFNGFGDITNLEKSRYEYKKAEAQVESYRRGLMMQATNARLAVRAAQQRIETARKGQEQAREVLDSVTRRYETGGASNVDLIDVQTAYTSAKTDYITAVYDYLIARVQLARATGTVEH